MDYMDFYITNDYGEADFQVPLDQGSIFILGKKYSHPEQEFDLIKADIRSKIWCTYRRGFVPLGSPQLTSDKGWGCMLRCGQMVLAQALVCLHLGRDWVWTKDTRDPTYLQIIEKFEDNRKSPFSLHQIALMGNSEDKKVGEWFGPNTIAQVLKKLVRFDEWSSIVIHVALDNIVATDEVIELCETKPLWTPLLLIIPLRLGLSEINPVYFDALKKCFELPSSCGMIGGRPNQALYFIGYVGNEALFLDPHTAQRSGSVGSKTSQEEIEMDETFHHKYANRIDFKYMDPSLAICFLCRNREEFDALIEQFQNDLFQPNAPQLFEVTKQRPEEWVSQPVVAASASTSTSTTGAGEFSFPDAASIVYSDNCNEEFENVEPNASDDEFEIIA